MVSGPVVDIVLPIFSHKIEDIDRVSADSADYLHRTPLATKIARELRQTASQRRGDNAGGVVGVYGRWGAGKSYLMSQVIQQLLLDNKLDEKTQIVVCAFSPWRYEMESTLAQGLIQTLRTIHNQFPGRNPWTPELIDKHKQLRDLIEKYKQAAGVLFVSMAIISVARTFLDPVGSIASLARSSSLSSASDVWRRNRSTPEEQQAQLFDKVDDLKKQMTMLVQQILEAAKKADETAHRTATKGGAKDSKDWTLVMFIDDLDRCSPDNMVHLFEWLKVHLLVDNITYVLALDHTAAARAIVGHYKEYLGENKDLDYGFRYLEKLVDTEYELELGRDVENMALSQVFIPAPGQSLPPKLSELARLMAKGDFPGIVFIDELASLRSLRIPRTMLKIVYKFSRALQTIEANTKEAAELRSRLPSSYPFWLILICAMYYRLDPDDVAEFTKHQGKIYEALTQENAQPDKNWHEGPQRDFFGFAQGLRRANLALPSSETLLELARVIRENTTDSDNTTDSSASYR